MENRITYSMFPMVDIEGTMVDALHASEATLYGVYEVSEHERKWVADFADESQAQEYATYLNSQHSEDSKDIQRTLEQLRDTLKDIDIAIQEYGKDLQDAAFNRTRGGDYIDTSVYLTIETVKNMIEASKI